MGAIRIGRGLTIPEGELTFTASRGGGPGGQHVNTAATRVTLHWNVRASPSVSDAQRRRIEKVLGNRISKDGVLQLSSHSERSQAANRAELQERFAKLLRRALRRRRRRISTKPTRGSEERRLRRKKRRAEVKKGRRPVRRPPPEEG